MKELGGIVAGIATLGLIFALSMSTTVSTGLGEVHNIGLMDRRQTYLMVSIAFVVIGIGVFIAGAIIDGKPASVPIEGSFRKCPECAESIKSEAKKCKHCGIAVEPIAQMCEHCAILIKKPNEPCSAFGKKEIEASLDRIKSSTCIEALRRANVLEAQAQPSSDGPVA
tara:strand:+ start:528 stop:1031 length:504 start_codon:yes stop_codon:yes gene_type:complete